MSDYPIIFSAPMVRALLDGRKTQTRRLAWRYVPTFPGSEDLEQRPTLWQKVKPGDRLWVRENIRLVSIGPEDWRGIVYRADNSDVRLMLAKTDAKLSPLHDTPSIHMPRWASRITLTVTDTRRQRLHEISEEDARAEGIEWRHGMFGTWNSDGSLRCGGSLGAREAFRCLWINLHGNGTWDANPEVVALSFSVAKINIDAQEAA